MCEDIESDVHVREPVIERLVGMDTGKDHSAWSKVPQPLHLGLPLHFPARTGFLQLPTALGEQGHRYLCSHSERL
jgi:hypothetical protein